MTRKMTLAMIALMLVPLLVSGTGQTTVARAAQTSYCATETEAAMLQRINGLRQNNGRAPLTLSAMLGVAAESKASDMASRDYFAHVSPEGQPPHQLLTSVGYPSNTSTGENIAAGYADADTTFGQWVNSPGHLENMLGAQYAAIGIGLAYNENSTYGWYWVTEFGSVVDQPATVCGSAPPTTTTGDELITRLIAILQRILANAGG